ncbi:hypothetical protein Dd1591_0721 [Dickeya chrysanthemi Ech1591]|uniref:Uncharacterized protein n=1 Tax=Dickeya chrysanthemi (strain Ech1591) TaxID=561229 RepID=C6CKV1_DICC1|nr:hypothetical protein Dd1591_0721 [Dickeya chrysanthemi Ech1591]
MVINVERHNVCAVSPAPGKHQDVSLSLSRRVFEASV